MPLHQQTMILIAVTQGREQPGINYCSKSTGFLVVNVIRTEGIDTTSTPKLLYDCNC